MSRITWILCLVLLTLGSCQRVTHIADTDVDYLRTDNEAPADKRIAQLIQPYQEKLSAEMDEVLGYLPMDLHKKRPNSKLGNWFTDILYEEANDNTLVAVDLDGPGVKQLADHIAAKNGWPISQNFNFKIVDDRAEDITIQGQPLDLKKSYRMAVPDYVANGGDASSFLKQYPQEDSGVYIRDVLIEHQRKLIEQEREIIIDTANRIH